MVIDFQAHIYPEAYLDEMKRIDGAVILEAPDPHSGMTYFYDKQLRCRINTATFQGQNIGRRIEHMDQLGIDIHVLTIPAPGADRFEARGCYWTCADRERCRRGDLPEISEALYRIFHLADLLG